MPGRPSWSFDHFLRRRKPADWPAADRQAWETALATGGPLSRPGKAAHLSPLTRKARQESYGQFLAWLDRIGELNPEETVADRVTPDRIGRFLDERRQTASDNTVHQQVRELMLAVQAMVPDRDWTWIRKHPAGPTYREARSARKPPVIFDIDALITAAEGRMRDAVDDRPTIATARSYRNALIVSFLAYHALRRANIASIRLGEHLTADHDAWRLHFRVDETKTFRVIDHTLEEPLAGFLEDYLVVHRPRLLLGKEPIPPGDDWAAAVVDHTDGALWINQNGQPLGYPAFQQVVMNTGLDLIGFPLTVHSFRHTSVTTIRTHDVTAMRTASALLGHRSAKVTMRHYDESGAQPAVDYFQRLVQRVRNEKDE